MDASGLHARFRHLPYPPDFQGNPELSALLEAILAEDEDEDKQKGLEEFLEVRALGLFCGGGWINRDRPVDGLKTHRRSILDGAAQVMVGKAYYHQQNPSDPDFASRATLIKWVYEHDFVNDYSKLPAVQVKPRLLGCWEGHFQLT